MQSNEIETKLTQARGQAQRLRRDAEKPIDDVEAALDLETRAEAAQRLVARLEVQLKDTQTREKVERERREKEAAQHRVSELETLYREGCDDLALYLDEQAEAAIRQIVTETVKKRGALLEVSNEHERLKPKALGRPIEPHERLWNSHSGPVPKWEHRLEGHKYSELYNAVVAALNAVLEPRFIGIRPTVGNAETEEDAGRQQSLVQAREKAMGL